MTTPRTTVDIAIAYAGEDSAIAANLSRRLRELGFECFKAAQQLHLLAVIDAEQFFEQLFIDAKEHKRRPAWVVHERRAAAHMTPGDWIAVATVVVTVAIAVSGWYGRRRQRLRAVQVALLPRGRFHDGEIVHDVEVSVFNDDDKGWESITVGSTFILHTGVSSRRCGILCPRRSQPSIPLEASSMGWPSTGCAASSHVSKTN